MKAAPNLTERQLCALEEMRAEFESMRLEVVLVPQRHRTNEGGCIRVCASKNAPWYRRFCARHSSSRLRKNALHDTRIKRAETSRILGLLCEGRATASQYLADFIAEADRRVREGRCEHAMASNENPF